MSNMENMSKSATVICLIVLLVCVYGWVHNLYIIWKFTGVVQGEILMRLIGVFAWPIGIVLGYF